MSSAGVSGRVNRNRRAWRIDARVRPHFRQGLADPASFTFRVGEAGKLGNRGDWPGRRIQQTVNGTTTGRAELASRAA
jgi:hypothetical protein